MPQGGYPSVRWGDLLRTDGHVHSTFSDGASDPMANLRAAITAGLTGLVMADHVRSSTHWLPAFVRTIRTLRAGAPMGISIGVETKILDTAGALDLPPGLAGVELLLIADHQVPTAAGPRSPSEVRGALEDGTLDIDSVLGWVLTSMTAAVSQAPLPAVLVHPFSILPKLGLSEARLPDGALRVLAERCRETGTAFEINEKWRCPSPATVHAFAATGVTIVAGSDAHDADAVGRYHYVRDVIEALAAATATR
jgi:putative hydrolase